MENIPYNNPDEINWDTVGEQGGGFKGPLFPGDYEFQLPSSLKDSWTKEFESSSVPGGPKTKRKSLFVEVLITSARRKLYEGEQRKIIRPVPARVYGQLRLVVASADVTLVDGLTFEDGTTSRILKVPSGMESGIKVQLASPIDADPGEVTIVVVDFDVDRNFVLQGETATTVKDVLFTPLLQEKRRQQAATP